ncbi:MAG: hypothetical protein WC554_02025 [Clostridia bacterium]|jgi:hypothetical protein
MEMDREKIENNNKDLLNELTNVNDNMQICISRTEHIRDIIYKIENIKSQSRDLNIKYLLKDALKVLENNEKHMVEIYKKNLERKDEINNILYR